MRITARILSILICFCLISGISRTVYADETETQQSDPEQEYSETEDHSAVFSFVNRLYGYCLGREADASGLDYWADLLISNKTGGYETARGFFNSTEFINMNLSNEEFVTVCYNTLLDRAPDSTGLDYWVDYLNSGTMSRDDIVSSFCNSSEFIGLCQGFGIINRLPDVRELYPEACAVLDQVGWDLRAAYDWTRDNIEYVRDINVDHRYTSRELAHRGFSTHNGNCFVFSACFYELACALGYDAHQMTGHITRSTGLVVIHSWVEIDIDGTTWAFDPEFEFVDRSRDGWYFQYGRSGTFRYQDIVRMN